MCGAHVVLTMAFEGSTGLGRVGHVGDGSSCGASHITCTLPVYPPALAADDVGSFLCGAHQAYQVDWEAILSRSAEPFIASVSAWLYPPAARGDPAAAAADAGAGAGAAASARQQHAPGANLEALPLVKDVLATGRQRLDALNALLDA